MIVFVISFSSSDLASIITRRSCGRCAATGALLAGVRLQETGMRRGCGAWSSAVPRTAIRL